MFFFFFFIKKWFIEKGFTFSVEPAFVRLWDGYYYLFVCLFGTCTETCIELMKQFDLKHQVSEYGFGATFTAWVIVMKRRKAHSKRGVRWCGPKNWKKADLKLTIAGRNWTLSIWFTASVTRCLSINRPNHRKHDKHVQFINNAIIITAVNSSWFAMAMNQRVVWTYSKRYEPKRYLRLRFAAVRQLISIDLD